MMRAQGKEILIGGELFTCVCSIGCALHMSSQLKNLKFLLGLQCLDGALMGHMWYDYDKIMVEIYMCKL